MARRERTTGLPRAKRRDRVDSRRRVGGVPLDERSARFAIIGLVGILFLLVVGLITYRVYDENIGRPNKVVLAVGEREVQLEYYTARLLPFAEANPGSSTAITAQALLGKLETEELTILLARERGIVITEDDITEAIAADLGVPPGGSGTAFDQLYRNRLRTLNVSDRHYRRLTLASVANDRLLEQFREEVGTTGEMVTVRGVALETEEEATAVAERARAGEDLGTIAQLESSDLATRSSDGLYPPRVLSLYPEGMIEAMGGTTDGDILGPVEAEGSFWVFRVERREAEGTIPEDQLGAVVQDRLDDAIAEFRKGVEISRSLSASDIDWAVSHAG